VTGRDPTHGGVAYDALVACVTERGSLAGLRALGRAGLSVIATAPSRSGVGMWSRYARHRLVSPDPATDPGGFTREIQRAVAEYRPRIVYPASEQAINAIAAHADGVVGLLPYGSLDSLDVARDKRRLPELARASGFAAPRTVAEGRAADLADGIDAPGGVIKAALPGAAKIYAAFADTNDALRVELRRLPPDEPVLVQERVRGELVGLALVVAPDGRLVDRFQQVSMRTWPLAGGVTCSAVGVAPDEAFVDQTRAMLANIGYAGLAHVQFLDGGDRRVLIDINTRFYGSLPLALASGVNLPAAWHSSVTGGEYRRSTHYRPGVRFRWLEGNALAAARGSLRPLIDCGIRRSHAVWAADDPVASAAWAAATLHERVRRRLPRRATSRASR
jgi:predicted ATP-grasp superfamily ATP-dependent carboligase